MAGHPEFRLLAYFVEIVRAGTIRGAAERLSLSPAVVSEALSELEAHVGVTLIQRSTRSMQLTAVGNDVFERAAEMVTAADDALRQGREAANAPSGTVRLTISGELCLSWLPPMLRSFEEAYPQARVALSVDDEAIELGTSDYDIAVRASFATSERGHAKAIAVLPLECVCAPGLYRTRESLQQRLSRIGVIGVPDLRRDRKAVFAVARNRAGKARTRVTAPCRFFVRDHVVAHRLALEGFGAALLMQPTVRDDLGSGRLVRVSERHAFGFAAVQLLLRDRHPTAVTRAFREILFRGASA